MESIEEQKFYEFNNALMEGDVLALVDTTIHPREEGGEDIRARMSKLLKKRASQSVVRLELSRKIGGEFLKLLKSRIRVDSHQIYFDQSPCA